MPCAYTVRIFRQSKWKLSHSFVRNLHQCFYLHWSTCLPYSNLMLSSIAFSTTYRLTFDSSVPSSIKTFTVLVGSFSTRVRYNLIKEIKDSKRPRIRLEHKEYPNKTLAYAIEEKLNRQVHDRYPYH